MSSFAYRLLLFRFLCFGLIPTFIEAGSLVPSPAPASSRRGFAARGVDAMLRLDAVGRYAMTLWMRDVDCDGATHLQAGTRCVDTSYRALC